MAAFRDERDAESTDDVMAEAVIRTMWLHPGDAGIVASAEVGDGMGPQIQPVLLASCVWACGLLGCERIYFCCFQPRSLWEFINRGPGELIQRLHEKCRDSNARCEWVAKPGT